MLVIAVLGIDILLTLLAANIVGLAAFRCAHYGSKSGSTTGPTARRTADNAAAWFRHSGYALQN